MPKNDFFAMSTKIEHSKVNFESYKLGDLFKFAFGLIEISRK